MTNGKGSTPRKVDRKKYAANWDKVFGKATENKKASTVELFLDLVFAACNTETFSNKEPIAEPDNPDTAAETATETETQTGANTK